MNDLNIYIIGAITTISLALFGILYSTEYKIAAIWLFFFSCMLMMLGITLTWISHVKNDNANRDIVKPKFSLEKKAWKKTNGPYASSVFAIKPDSKNNSIVYASYTNNNRISISNNHGKTWELIKDFTLPYEIRSLSIFQNNTNRILAGTTGKLLDINLKNNVATEIEYFKKLGRRGVRTIAISNDNPDLIFIGTGEESWGARSIAGVAIHAKNQNDSIDIEWVDDVKEGDFHISTDGGLHWVSAKSIALNEAINDIAFSPISGNIVYMVSSEGKVYVSENSGQNWRKTHDLKRPIFDISLSYKSPTYAFVATRSGVYYTNDFGNSWQKSKGISKETYAISNFRSKPNIIYAGTINGLYKSTNHGKSFYKINIKNNFHKILSLASLNDESTLVGTDGFGIKILKEGSGHFIDSRDKNKKSHGVLSLHSTNDNEILVGTSTGLYKTEDKGSSFTHIGFFNFKTIWSISSKRININSAKTYTWNRPKLVLVGTNDGSIYISSDMGDTWKEVYSNNKHQPITYILSEDRSQNIYAVVAQSTVLESTDNGENWEKISSKELENEKPYSIEYFIDDNNNKTIVVGTVTGKIFTRKVSGLWRELTVELPSKGIESLLYVRKSRDWSLFATISGSGVYSISSNNILTNISRGLKSKTVRHLLKSRIDSNLIYAATDKGVYKFDIKKSKWTEYLTGLGEKNINQLVISNDGKNIYAGEQISFYGRIIE